MTVVAILVLVALALVLPRRRLEPRHGRRRPSNGALVAAGAGFGVAFLLSFFLLPLAGLPGWSIVTAAVLLAVAGMFLVRWSRAPDWDLRAAVMIGLGASRSRRTIREPVTRTSSTPSLWAYAVPPKARHAHTPAAKGRNRSCGRSIRT